MLTLLAAQAESLWDEALPVEVRELAKDLAALDRVLSDPRLLAGIVERFRREGLQTRRAVLTDGRPTIAMDSYVRLMVLKARYRWGYRTLVAEVSDSIHLPKFCRISLSQRVPDESTVRKLTRRIGAETVSELTRALIVAAVRDTELSPDRVFISGRQEPGSRRTNRRLQRYRTGEEGRVSHLKRRYGIGRSRLKGHEGQRICSEWAILAYNADTLAIRTR